MRPASINVRAEIETLVAVKAPPMKSGDGPRQAEQVPDARAQKKRPDHAGKRHDKCSDAGFLHSIDIRLDARHEHQYVAADLRKQQERIGGLSAAKKMPVQKIEQRPDREPRR